MANKVKLIVLGWTVSVFALFLYSFTQIDLGLTLTRALFWQPIQRAFQQIGYFQRPLSASFYLLILVLLFIFYFLLLSLVKRSCLNSKQVWVLIFLTAFLLWFSYNAFSYDLFNYIFDAKIITFYHQNPYQHMALDFPGDPMLGFMHWTHRLYPYGPVWLVLTIPLSFFGWQKFIPTALLIKALAVLSYLLSAWLIFKITKRLEIKNPLIGLAIFAFNPLVVIESLVSAHNDILMMALVLAAFWFLIEKKYFWVWLLFFLSVGIKFATGILLPVFLLVSWRQLKEKVIGWEKVWWSSLGLMVLAVFLASWRIGEIKPWYWLYPLPFAGLLPGRKWLFCLMISLSAGLLLHYAPFLYLGNWNPPIPVIKNWLTVSFLALGIMAGVLIQKGVKIKSD